MTWAIVSKNFYRRNLLVRVNQEGILYNRLSQRKTRYWATILYYTLGGWGDYYVESHTTICFSNICQKVMLNGFLCLTCKSHQ
jgi:hypothetical protein